MDYGQPVRFGIFLTPEATDRPLRLAALADELGYDIVGVQDHPYQRRFFDTWTLLTAIAMRTEGRTNRRGAQASAGLMPTIVKSFTLTRIVLPMTSVFPPKSRCHMP